ncbi:hypothetical protein OGAPHI_000970 [Ogataea philodendri]|uniref:Uncharacterized protein n=1 Tax=Ogataea philodendri TaxID=1378263 RepID=A0A9P8PF23_9ASCO|nr:uncharacterized protein OGAPHI_000970 [Ogataea philodendri]KAH3670455.1 hypothetical protein OGAPHI_000970 [Ogataea philodendri]
MEAVYGGLDKDRINWISFNGTTDRHAWTNSQGTLSLSKGWNDWKNSSGWMYESQLTLWKPRNVSAGLKMGQTEDMSKAIKRKLVTLVSNVLVVQVVEGTRKTLVEFGVVTDGQESVRRNTPSSSVDGTGLWWWAVELDLMVGDNGTDSSFRVVQDTVFQGNGQSTGLVARHGIDVVTRSRGSGGGAGRGCRSGGRSLHLAVRDLGSNTAGGLRSRGGGGGSLHLSVRDLGNNISSSRGRRRGRRGGVSLNLAISDLGHDGVVGGCRWSGGGGLDLAVADLGHNSSIGLLSRRRGRRRGGCGGLDLAVGDLRNNSSGSALLLGGGGGGLGLSVGGSLDLTVTDLRNNLSLLQSERRHASRSRGNWLDSNTESGRVAGQSSVQSSGRSKGGPVGGANVGSECVGSQRNDSERGREFHNASELTVLRGSWKPGFYRFLTPEPLNLVIVL